VQRFRKKLGDLMAIRTNFEDVAMTIGDFLPCRYVAPNSGSVGTFVELGTTTATAIPVESSATPDGSFNFIYVGNDEQGRKIFVADRNIQHSVKWDTLNIKGIATGSGVELDGNEKFFIKLPDPSELPTGTGYGTTFSPDGVYLAVAHYSSPRITIYKRDGDTFTKLDNPNVLPAHTSYSIAFSPDGIYMAVANDGYSRITI
jgi:6-phosphogluconolactonase (cycloisomerase 2 family)